MNEENQKNEEKKQYISGRKVLFSTQVKYLKECLQNDDIEIVKKNCFNVLLQLTNIDKISIIYHDKFSDDELAKEPNKEPHLHFVCTFNNSTTFKSIADCLGLQESMICKIKKSVSSAFAYLIHFTNTIEIDEDVTYKYKYSVDEVLSNWDYKNFISQLKVGNNCIKKLSHFEQEEIEYKEKVLPILLKIDKGEINAYNLVENVDIETYTKHFNKFQKAIKYYNDKQSVKVDRIMNVFFIQGISGCGKTTYAKMMCKSLGMTPYISSGGANPLDNYGGQRCIILDDIRPSDYKLNELLKLLDNNTQSMIHCRFYNKSIANCEYIIITSTLTLENWYKNIQETDNEQIKQFYRRIQVKIIMDMNSVTEYHYNLLTDEYVYISEMDNLISSLYDKEKTKSFVSNLLSSVNAEINEEIQKKINTNIDNNVNKTNIDNLLDAKLNENVPF